MGSGFWTTSDKGEGVGSKIEKISDVLNEQPLSKILIKTHCEIKKIVEMLEFKAKASLKSQSEGEKIIFIEITCGDKKFNGLSPFLH